MTDTTAAPERRTKRRYAHELYPHAEEYETRTLEVEVPYLYARAFGFDVGGTSWFDMRDEQLETASNRTREHVAAKQIAFLADALLQGKTGQDAWAWADQAMWDYEGGVAFDRAVHYGVQVDQIKPYPCGPEPDKHDHVADPDANGFRFVTVIKTKESECPDCTEEVS